MIKITWKSTKFFSYFSLLCILACGPDFENEVPPSDWQPPKHFQPPIQIEPPTQPENEPDEPIVIKPPIKILSMDGGGIRGIMTASLLEGFEEATRKKTYELFDIIAGTSTGGLIALCLTTPNKEGSGSILSAKKIKNFYRSQAGEMFKKNSYFFSGPLYDTLSFEGVIKALVGKRKFNNLLKPTLITAFDIERRKGHSLESDIDLYKNLSLLDVARSTSAAPTYFQPKLIYLNSQGESAEHYMVDGGVFKNNPAILAYRKAKILFGEEANKRGIILISIGTGNPLEKVRSYWSEKNLINMKLILSTKEDESILKDIFEDLPNSKLIRIQAQLDNRTFPGIVDLDNITESNLDNLLKVAEQVKNSPQYKSAVELLKLSTN